MMSVKRTTSCDVVSRGIRMRRGSLIWRRVCLSSEPLSSFTSKRDPKLFRGHVHETVSRTCLDDVANQVRISACDALRLGEAAADPPRERREGQGDRDPERGP